MKKILLMIFLLSYSSVAMSAEAVQFIEGKSCNVEHSFGTFETDSRLICRKYDDEKLIWKKVPVSSIPP